MSQLIAHLDTSSLTIGYRSHNIWGEYFVVSRIYRWLIESLCNIENWYCLSDSTIIAHELGVVLSRKDFAWYFVERLENERA